MNLEEEEILPRYTAIEVLKLYDAGRRNFMGTNLRGVSFEGKNLSGINFSAADIRGANFTNAILKNANFAYAKAGPETYFWNPIQFIFTFLFFLVLLFIGEGIYTNFLGFVFINEKVSEVRLITKIIPILGFFANHLVIAIQGLTTKALRTVVIVWTIQIVSIGIITGRAIQSLTGAIILIVIAFLAVIIAVTTAILGSGTRAGRIACISAVIILFIFFLTIFVYFGERVSDFKGYLFVLPGLVTIASFSLYIRWRALQNDEKFSLVRITGVAIGAIGGTSFRGADLTGADFIGAILGGTNFKNAILTHTYWREAKKLDRARVGKSVLAEPKLRELLVSGNGYNKSYIRANLRGVNLQDANLSQANLQWADISGATLRQANLQKANLSKTLALGTDFTAAFFTGVCLEAWNIDSSTRLEKVDCQFVYLLPHQQERVPSSGDFARGEFTKLFQQVMSTMVLLFRNGVDWRAFVVAFKTIQVKNEILNSPSKVSKIKMMG